MNRPLPVFFRCLVFLFVAGTLAAQGSIGGDRPGAPAEQYPVLQPDGKKLYFVRPDFADNKGTDNAADIWVRNRNADGSWQRALNPGSPINSFAHDRILSVSPDGNRLGILRTGAVSYLDLLEISGRSWRIIDSWTIPEDVYPRYDLTFDVNAQELTYSAYADGQLDLFRRRALPGALWTEPEPLTVLNGPEDESSPTLAPDGRTLYFRRNAGRWYRQTDRNLRPRAVSIPPTALSFTPSLLTDELIAAEPTSNGKLRLRSLPATTTDLPPRASLTRGQLRAALPAGQTTATIQLSEATELSVRPDALNRYAVFLRPGEDPGARAATTATGNPTVGEPVVATTDAPPPLTDRQLLENGIAQRQAALDRLDNERRKYDLVAPRTTDPELSALQQRYDAVTGRDTVPPTTGNRATDRYAAELAELERMKARFRRQQEDRLQQRNGTTPATAPSTTTRTAKGSRPATYGNQRQTASRNAARGPAYQDSLRIASEVAASLRRDATPRAYEREAWENEVRQGLPRTEPLSREESARLDAEYQKSLTELETLRARLRKLEGPPTNPQPVTQAPPAAASNPQWQARSSEPAPATYGTARPSPPATSPYPAPATAPTAQGNRATDTYSTPYPTATPSGPARYSGAPMPAGISFIPNTAYPDSRGYQGLDQLIGLIRQSTSVLEIRVHTPAELDPRVAQLLSEERAVTIRNHLLSQGVPQQNFRTVGFGNNLTGPEGERVEVVR